MRQDDLKVECRAGIQHLDPGANKLHIGAWRFIIAGVPSGFDLGTADVGAKQNVAVEMMVWYIKGVLDGQEIFEKDKVNMINRVLGTDYATNIRQAIGI